MLVFGEIGYQEVSVLKNKPYQLYPVEHISNLKELVGHAANKYGEYAAFIYERNKETMRVSYRRFKSDIEALGTAFFDMGISNTKIAVIGENSYEWILTYFATVNGGNIIVPLDKELPLSEIKSLLIHSDTTVLVYSDEYSDVADGLRKSGLELSHYINMATDLPALIEKGNTLISAGNTSFIDYPINSDALATILYTSGTTGSPKGVMISHKNMAAATVASCKNVYVESTTLLVLPLHHVYAMTVNILCILHWGAMIAINSGLKNVSSDLVKYKPKTIFLVPLFVETLYKRIWDTANKSGKINC